jgi:hypothetical protein
LVDDLWLSTNNYYVRAGIEISNVLVCAWGANAKMIMRRHAHAPRMNVEGVARQAGKKAFCLGTNKDNSPKHPLYIKDDQPLVRWP